MAVFYQTYRPLNFSQVIGQDPIVLTLKQAVHNGRLGHAYLFTGSRGVGKTTLARILAKAVNCEKLDNGDPCGECALCTSIAQGNFLDSIEIDAASHTGVDNIRELIERVQFQPSMGKKKVFIIDEVHMLSKAAFNALLKTLEEPPAHALFILATTDIEKLPETIISRTQRFDFKKITDQHLLESLKQIVKKEKLTLPEGALEIIVENSQGGLRDAQSQLSLISVLDKTAKLEDVHALLGTTSESQVVELLSYIASGNSNNLPEFFRKQTELNFDASAFTRKVLFILQALLEQNLGSKIIEVSPDLQGKFSLNELLYLIRLYLRAYKEIDRALSPELPLLLASVEAALYISNNRNKPNSEIAKQEIISDVESEKPVKKIEVQPVKEVNVPQMALSSNIELNMDQVREWWPELVEHIRGINNPLATFLKNSPLHEVKSNQVVIAVKYLFHKEHIESAKNRAMISDFLTAKAGGQVDFRASIVKDSVGEKIADTATAVSDALKIFGGELVE
jgi:DNA polymerase III subunit gamma/tau